MSEGTAATTAVRSVTVVPESFTLVDYDAAEVAALVAKLADEVGLPEGVAVRVEVDETTPLGRVAITALDPLTLWVESGALEDAKRLRQLSPTGAAHELGLLLLLGRDRLDPAFGAPPLGEELSQREQTAWEVYAAGRLVRLGYTHHDDRQRRLFHFRTRHGFSDVGDDAFERLWTADGLTWADIRTLSARADTRH